MKKIVSVLMIVVAMATSLVAIENVDKRDYSEVERMYQGSYVSNEKKITKEISDVKVKNTNRKKKEKIILAFLYIIVAGGILFISVAIIVMMSNMYDKFMSTN